MTPLRLSLPPAALEPELHSVLEAVDALAPPQMDPALGATFFERGVVELDAQTRFLPVPLDQPLPAKLFAVAVVGGLLGGCASMAALWLLDIDLQLLISVGLLGGAGAGWLSFKLVTRSVGPVVACTGLLLRPDLLLIRRPRTVDVIPREALETIDEQMREEPGSNHQPPTSYYEARLVFKPRLAAQVWRIVELGAQGELGMSVRASHEQGRFVGELVRYLVRKWLRSEDSVGGPNSGPR